MIICITCRTILIIWISPVFGNWQVVLGHIWSCGSKLGVAFRNWRVVFGSLHFPSCKQGMRKLREPETTELMI